MFLHKYHVYVPCSNYSIDDLCTTLRFGVQQKDLPVNWPRNYHMASKSLRVNLMEVPCTSSINLSRPVSWTSIQDNWLGEETMELLDSSKRLLPVSCVDAPSDCVIYGCHCSLSCFHIGMWRSTGEMLASWESMHSMHWHYGLKEIAGTGKGVTSSLSPMKEHWFTMFFSYFSTQTAKLRIFPIFL